MFPCLPLVFLTEPHCPQRLLIVCRKNLFYCFHRIAFCPNISLLPEPLVCLFFFLSQNRFCTNISLLPEPLVCQNRFVFNVSLFAEQPLFLQRVLCMLRAAGSTAWSYLSSLHESCCFLVCQRLLRLTVHESCFAILS